MDSPLRLRNGDEVFLVHDVSIENGVITVHYSGSPMCGEQLERAFPELVASGFVLTALRRPPRRGPCAWPPPAPLRAR